MSTFRLTILLSLLVFSGSFNVSAQDNVRYNQQDLSIFHEVVTQMKDVSYLPVGELVTKIALDMLGTPYVAATLEQEPEILTVNLRETDCILFVEMCTALALTIKSENPTFEEYCDQIKKLRYRNGLVDGYVSRIHYTSEWIKQNSERGVMREFTSEYGDPLDQEFSYMSTHPDSYKQLKDCPDRVREIAGVENILTQSGPYFYIPQDKIEKCAPKINSGDIVCFRSNVRGLDISHVGLAYWDKDELKFIHASFKEKKVVIDRKTIADYAKNGIRIIRFN